MEGMQLRYTVRFTDSLKGIAKKFYGDESMWVAVYNHNLLVIPDINNLSVGAVISLPHSPHFRGVIDPLMTNEVPRYDQGGYSYAGD